jgi:hypothetical protein
MSDKPLSRRALRPRRSGERTMPHGAPALRLGFENCARQLLNAVSEILGLAILPLIQLAPTPLVTVKVIALVK